MSHAMLAGFSFNSNSIYNIIQLLKKNKKCISIFFHGADVSFRDVKIKKKPDRGMGMTGGGFCEI